MANHEWLLLKPSMSGDNNLSSEMAWAPDENRRSL